VVKYCLVCPSCWYIQSHAEINSDGGCFINWTVNADFIVVQNSNLKPADVNKAD